MDLWGDCDFTVRQFRSILSPCSDIFSKLPAIHSWMCLLSLMGSCRWAVGTGDGGFPRLPVHSGCEKWIWWCFFPSEIIRKESRVVEYVGTTKPAVGENGKKKLCQKTKQRKGPQGRYSLLLRVSNSGKQAWMCDILWFKTNQNWTNGLLACQHAVKMYYVFVLSLALQRYVCVCVHVWVCVCVCVCVCPVRDAHNCMSELISHESFVCRICVSCSLSLSCSNVPQGVPLCRFWHHVNISFRRLVNLIHVHCLSCCDKNHDRRTDRQIMERGQSWANCAYSLLKDQCYFHGFCHQLYQLY